MKSVIGFTPRDSQSFSMDPHLSYDGCYTLAELFDRYISGLPLPQRPVDGFIDDDPDNPLDYDADIADYPTPYTDFDSSDAPSSDPAPVAPKSAAPAAPTPPSVSEQGV